MTSPPSPSPASPPAPPRPVPPPEVEAAAPSSNATIQTPPSTPIAHLPSPNTSSPSPPSPRPSSPSPELNSHTPPSRIPPPTPPALVARHPPPGKRPPPTKQVAGVAPSPGSDSMTLVVAVAVGAVVLLLLLGMLCFCCRRKKRRLHPPPGYYGGPPAPPPPGKDGCYVVEPQSLQHHRPPPSDNHYQAQTQHPQPNPQPPFSSRPQYLPHSSSSLETPHRPPPPPPIITNTGVSGSTNSSSEAPLPPPSPGLGLSFSKSTFTYEELAIATNWFSDAHLLGQGGFGNVHKGILPNGKEVAIKKLKSGSGQGDREFHAEVDIISRVHHKHLVSLAGYCISGGQRLLVYKYVPNKTLEFHLHGKDRPTMDWPTRLRIALGSAKGLAYLHEDCNPKIIHRDIKAANILLDHKFEAKVSDFGLAKFASDDNTHVSTRVMGTFGYLAPEYALSGKLTDKSDVFSFGVMLLEMITGKKPVDTANTSMYDCLVDWARPLLAEALEEGIYDHFIDQRLGKNYNPYEMARMIACAAACVRHSARRRPRMGQIVRALETDVSQEDLNNGGKPGHRNFFGSYTSSDFESGQYNNDMKKFRKKALTTRDYIASGYSEATSEYGLISSASSSDNEEIPEVEFNRKKKNTHSFSRKP